MLEISISTKENGLVYDKSFTDKEVALKVVNGVAWLVIGGATVYLGYGIVEILSSDRGRVILEEVIKSLGRTNLGELPHLINSGEKSITLFNEMAPTGVAMTNKEAIFKTIDFLIHETILPNFAIPFVMGKLMSWGMNLRPNGRENDK